MHTSTTMDASLKQHARYSWDETQPAPPDEMFRHERKSPLLRVFRAWWGHFKYLIVAVIVVCMMLYSIVHAATEKCKHGLTRELFEAEGQAGVRCLSQSRVKNVSFLFSPPRDAAAHHARKGLVERWRVDEGEPPSAASESSRGGRCSTGAVDARVLHLHRATHRGNASH